MVDKTEYYLIEPSFFGPINSYVENVFFHNKKNEVILLCKDENKAKLLDERLCALKNIKYTVFREKCLNLSDFEISFKENKIYILGNIKNFFDQIKEVSILSPAFLDEIYKNSKISEAFLRSQTYNTSSCFFKNLPESKKIENKKSIFSQCNIL